MADEFLERFEQRRQERLHADRTFTLAGETLTHKASVAPEVGQRLEATRDAAALQLGEASAVAQEIQKRLAAANGSGVDLTGIDVNALKFSDQDLVLTADETILACLEPASHEAWARLRDTSSAYPLNFEEIMSIADYLIGRVTGIPTGEPAGSASGLKKTGKRSRGASSSTDKTPVRSPSEIT